jgi:hypothetical protein
MLVLGSCRTNFSSNAKFDREKFDYEMKFDIHRLYISQLAYAVQPERLHPILVSNLLYCYEELSYCISKLNS